MKLEQLHYLEEAIKYKSISVAAEKNYVSQSTLSAAIAKLESELGATLLNRTSKGVAPTEIGESILENAKVIFEATDKIFAIANEQKHIGTVTISCIPCICNRVIPKTLQKLREQHSTITLSVKTAESRPIAHAVSSGISEFGILINYEGLDKNTDLKYTPLFHDYCVLYVGRNSPFWNNKSISLEEAIRQPYVAYREEFLTDNGGLTSVLGPSKIPNITFRTDDLDALKRLIALDDYVAFFPQFMSQDDYYTKAELIRSIPISDAVLPFEVGYIESTKYKINQMDKTVLKVLKETIQTLKE